MDTLAVILAGGQSRRMGRDKGTLPFDGVPLLEATARKYQGVFDAAAVSVDRPGRYPGLGLPELPDQRRGAGPLAGLEAAFTLTDARTVFLTAVDLPFADADLARRLVELRGNADVCIIRRGQGGREPTFAVYGRSCLPHITACLDAGERAFRAFFPLVEVRQVAEAELPGWDLARVLLNVNRPEDYRRALDLLHQGAAGL